MATRSHSQSSHTRGSRGGNSRRGFAAMSKSQRERIAAMGGRASHGGSSRSRNEDDYDDDDSNSRSRGGSGRGRQGFASMDRDEQRRIASEGGRASHGGGRSYYDEDEYDDRNERYAGGSNRDYDEDYEEGARYEDEDDDNDDYNEGRYASSRDDDRDSDYESDRDHRGEGRGRGFAGMDPEEQRHIASMGGRASHRGSRSRNGHSRGRNR